MTISEQDTLRQIKQKLGHHCCLRIKQAWDEDVYPIYSLTKQQVDFLKRLKQLYPQDFLHKYLRLA
jgi:hypothetical protein